MSIYLQTLVANIYAVCEPDLPQCDIFNADGFPEEEKIQISWSGIRTLDDGAVTKEKEVNQTICMFTWKQEKKGMLCCMIDSS
jgi:hypothetical protein